MKESSLVAKIIAAVKEKYPLGYVRKLADKHTRGLPDLMILAFCFNEYHGTSRTGILFVETKTIKGKTTKLQDAELQAIRNTGSETLVARDVESVLAKLEEMNAWKSSR